MGFSRKWKPSASAKREFAKQMEEIDAFCDEHNIIQSRTSDSYYFTINDVRYRVSNHTVAKSDEGMYAFNQATWQYEKKRDSYHTNDDIDIYITASKTRLIEIYQKLAKGIKLDKRGYEVYGGNND